MEEWDFFKCLKLVGSNHLNWSEFKFKGVILLLERLLEPRNIEGFQEVLFCQKSVSEWVLCSLNRFRRQKEYLDKCKVFFSLCITLQITVPDEKNLPLLPTNFLHMSRISTV